MEQDNEEINEFENVLVGNFFSLYDKLKIGIVSTDLKENKEKIKNLEKYISMLPEKEEDVLRFRNLLFDDKFCDKYETTSDNLVRYLHDRHPNKNKIKSFTLEEVLEFIKGVPESIRQAELRALDRLKSFLFFDPLFESESLKLKEELESLYPGFENYLTGLREDVAQKFIYNIFRGRDPLKKKRLGPNFVQKFEDVDLHNLSLLKNERDVEIMSLIYNFNDSELRNKYGLPEKSTFVEIGSVFGLKMQNITGIKRKYDEILGYLSYGVKIANSLPEIRKNVVKKYRKFVDESLGDIEDEMARDVLGLIYNLDKDSLVEKYGQCKSNLTRKEISEMLGIQQSKVNGIDNKAFKQLWRYMKPKIKKDFSKD